jgi:starch synthase (maltosyl-transferring)
MQRPTSSFAPRIYYFHPLLAGPIATWRQHLQRVQEMGFDTILTAPLFAPGSDGSLFLTADHERAHPGLGATLTADDAVTQLSEACHGFGLKLYSDVVLGAVSAEAPLVSERNWFRNATPFEQRVDPRGTQAEHNAAFARFDDPVAAPQLTEWWVERLCRLAATGISGFGCQDLALVPAQVWRDVIGAVRARCRNIRFLAWTPGLDWSRVIDLRGAGFDAAFSSIAWWDGRASWFVEEHEVLRGVGSVINCVEPPFAARLARSIEHPNRKRATYRYFLKRAAATGSGLLVPMGVEFAADRDMSRHGGSPDDLGAMQAPCSGTLAADIKQANALAGNLARLALFGEMRTLTDPQQPTTALLRCDARDIRQAQNAVLVIINPDLQRSAPVQLSLAPLPPAAGAALRADAILDAESDTAERLAGGEVRVLHACAMQPIVNSLAPIAPADLKAAPRIVIGNMNPGVAGGRFAAKCIVGDPVVISADVFVDGHDLLGAEALWRNADEKSFRRIPMRDVGNDRWEATVLPDRIGRCEFTVEAWRDNYGTFCRELDLKRNAGADVSVEIAEGKVLLQRAQAQAPSSVSKVLGSTLTWLRDVSVDSSVEILLSSDLREVMRLTEERRYLHRHEPLSIDVERPQAQFGSWYELFPRSITAAPERHGTLSDVIARLPTIRDMGFDVLYLAPIHPIGHKNRKGKNNSLRSTPTDVGSPYAIGNSDGGHDAIHRELGTIEDFRRLRDAARAEGLELALDFAIQCSPDHPWIKEHPEWFDWRPDGSVRYAENPPKKYEDIVNVDFYATGAIPALWFALRDIVLFWAKEGVRIFRVDNPHTKPLPFWEWMIADIRSRYPDMIFLSEAFTRPKMMFRLAQVGFSQSYTYFTWRNTKQELTDYFVELTTTEAKNFFRPHLFVNTPDINPYFLQTSGRPGFLIRAALAATLSGLWGMYSGYEICEAAALPGREEYLDSEKYEIRVRDFNAAGNIVEEISKLNRIRKSHPALQSHLGLQFFPAHNNQIIFYGKPLPAKRDLVLVAVSLDPFHVQEATIEVPLWEWGLPDDASVVAHDLMRDSKSTWHGKLQRIRLDPADLPFAMWRVTPTGEL